MKSYCEYIRVSRFKLRMMSVFSDNQAVLSNTTSLQLHSTFKKKYSSVAYYFVRKGVVKNECRATYQYLNANLNPAEMKRLFFTTNVSHFSECVICSQLDSTQC